MKTLKTLALIGAVAAGSSAMANTISPTTTAFVPGVAVTYSVNHTSGVIKTGDGFTIYDVGGYTGVLLMPPGWSLFSTAPIGSIYDTVGTLVPGDSPDVNVTFRYTGPNITDIFTTTFITPFVIGTTSTKLGLDYWASRDHLLGGGLGSEHQDEILTPTHVPDGGATAMLLGLGVLSLGAVRRKLS